MSVSVAPLFLLINSLLEKQLQVCYLRSEKSQRCHEFTCKQLYAWTSANSGGSGVLGCLLSKCCLKVLGSGICVLQTVQVYIKAALAAAFWSCPCFFFCPACFLAFFCWDWIFCCPRAISGPGQSCVGETAQRERAGGGGRRERTGERAQHRFGSSTRRGGETGEPGAQQPAPRARRRARRRLSRGRPLRLVPAHAAQLSQ